MNIFGGLIGIVAGFLIIKYTFQLVNTFGQIGWAEQNIGSGGTYTLSKVVGVLIIVFSFLHMFGGLGGLLSPLAPFFGGGR